MSEDLSLAFGLRFEDLYCRDGLARLDGCFVDVLKRHNTDLHNRLTAGRAAPDELTAKAHSDLIVELAVELDDFIAVLFGVAREVEALRERHDSLAPLYAVKRLFVQRRAAKKYGPDQAASFDGQALRGQLETLIGGELTELRFAERIDAWMKAEAEHAAALDLAARYAAWAAHTPQGQRRHKGGVLFKLPRKIDPHHLIAVETELVDGVAVVKLPVSHRRARDGFALTDSGADLAGALDHANYCIWCHNQGKDSCAKGLKEKSGEFKKSAFGVALAGCPLEEKISEMNLVEAGGHTIGALAIVAIDNPMCAATGHRICNDCMMACIYQKQEPVDIPQVETRILKEVLALPWGFEIYGLLTRWNPLDLRRPLPKPATGRKVLVVGLGPAGFTLAHHLINDGHTIVAVDGLKIEPLESEISGVGVGGARASFRPIRDAAELREPLDARVMAGFGGVAEYGITVRWDKNFLKLIRLLIERRQHFAMFGGVRFGGTLDADGAFTLGFDHIALATGAGRPTVLELPNGLANGVRAASDFLMALQLTGAARVDSVANMQVRLPIVVIGGGLTAIDTATESLAYYPVQIEKFLARYEELVAERGTQEVESAWTAAEADIAKEYLTHARAVRAERAAAAKEGRPPRVLELLQRWGGATIAYRRRLIDSPSYTLNHEEVEKALEEGIRFAEGLTPIAIEVDDHGHVRALRVSMRKIDSDGGMSESGEAELSARTLLVAAGTQPNTVLAREDATHFQLDGKYFAALDEEGKRVAPVKGLAKPDRVSILTSLEADGRAISYFGDLHPSFFGNVVKAMGSAKQGYPIVSRMLSRIEAASAVSDEHFIALLNDELRATVERVERLTPTIVEVVVRAPAAARRFAPGQFYRLQNFEMLAPSSSGTRLTMEGIALTGAWVDRERGVVSTIVLEMGGSSNLCATL